jgi:predicted cupin superfamily sugar epimerase
MHPRAAGLIATLGLQPHPEGGFYREIFRSTSAVTPGDGRPQRAALTTIYFLLTDDTWSRWHSVSSDEAWHLYEGGPLELLELDLATRMISRRNLAPVGDAAGEPAHVVAAGRWQAARSLGAYSLVGCTVGPGFDFADFRMLSDDEETAALVRQQWPDLAFLV